MAMKRKFQKRGKKSGPKPRMAVKRAQRIVSEFADLKVNRSYSLLTTNQVYNIYNTQLSSNARAVSVAQAYQFYRIKRITVKFSPLQDTFAGAGTTVPYLYCMIDRTRNLSNQNTVSALKKLGCKPRRLDDKIVSFSWRPSVLIGTYDSLPPASNPNVFQATQYKISPWLTTRDQDSNVWVPDSTDHLGIVFAVENAGGTNIQYKMETVVEFEFKKPSIDLSIDETQPAPIDVETLALDDASAKVSTDVPAV